MSTLAVLPAIRLDDQGAAWIEGTRMMVSLIACEKQGGRSEEEIQAHHPHLTLAQIHAALAYYYDHQAEMDAQIEAEDRQIQAAIEAAQADPAFHARKQALKERFRKRQDKAS